MAKKFMIVSLLFCACILCTCCFLFGWIITKGSYDSNVDNKFREQQRNEFRSKYNIKSYSPGTFPLEKRFFQTIQEVEDSILNSLHTEPEPTLVEVIDGIDGNANIHIIQDNLYDDSVKAIEIYYSLDKFGDEWTIKETLSRIQCRPGRGISEWHTGTCL